jgi:hypothetical protein
LNRLAAQLMELAIVDFPGALLPPGGADELRGVIAGLAPWRMLYFECRLSGTGGRVDVSQHFHASNSGADVLLELALRRSGELDGDAASAWHRIADVAALWRNDTRLAEAMTEIGLEYDVGLSGTWQAVPALFAGFGSGLLPNRESALIFVETVLPDGMMAWRRLVTTLKVAEQHGLSAGRLVGVMLSRNAEMRCMMRDLRPDRVRAFLDQAGWPGVVSVLVDLLSLPVFQSAGALLVLDHAPELVAGCGIEMIYGQDDEKLPERTGLLRWLMDRELADPTRVAALDEWRGTITPINARADWPDALIGRALTEGEDRLLYLRRFVNHVKLNISGGEITAAKAYRLTRSSSHRPGRQLFRTRLRAGRASLGRWRAVRG